MRKYHRDEIKEIVLLTLLAVGFLAFAITMPNAVQIFKYFGTRNTYDRARIKQSVYRLEKQGFIKKKDEGFILTKKGENKALFYKIESMKIVRQKKWDRSWRIVMFDVPESKKQARRAINFMLKEIGCVQYQKSVFITPFPCKEEIDLVGNYFGVRDHIRFFVASEIEDQETFRKIFDV